MHRLIALILVLVAVAGCQGPGQVGSPLASRRTAGLVAIVPPDRTTQADLARIGYSFTPVAIKNQPNSSVESAIDTARALFTAPYPDTVYLGRLRVIGAPDLDRPVVFGVQLLGVESAPIGPPRASRTVSPSLLHKEMIVFVDAMDGTFLAAVTVR